MAGKTPPGLVKAPRTRKVRASKSAQYLTDLKHMGDEPEVAGKILDGLELGKVLNWYDYMCSRKEAREYMEQFLKTHNRVADIATLKRVPEVWIDPIGGWLARIVVRGGSLGPDGTDRVNHRINETLKKVNAKVDELESSSETTVKEKPSIQERSADKASEWIGELDELIDQQGWAIDVYEWLTKRQIPVSHAKRIADFFKPIATEANLLNSKKVDEQLLEGYSHYTKTQIKQRALFYSKLVSDCERFADVAKKQKQPRKKKPITVDKKLKNFKFQTESKEYKVVSIKPEKLLGAQELWTFNTKYKTLHIFYALDRAGFDVQGTTLKNFDEAKSTGYRIGRKTEEHVATALKGGKRAVGKMLETLSKCVLQHRVNENTILLRIE